MKPEGPVYSIVYVSSATGPMERPDLDALLATARANNERLGITGMLLYFDGCFIQALEGERETVESVYATIRQDPRHRRVMLIHEETLDARVFPEWSMGFRDIGSSSPDALPGFSDFLNPGSDLHETFEQSPAAVHKLLASFRRCSGIVPDLGEVPRD